MTNNSRHSELEIKLDADDVNLGEFLEWCMYQHPERFEYISGPDTMYSNGDNVVRHRHRENKTDNFLTVKLRKSDTSIMDRVEVDLLFKENITSDDVEAFLLASGWKKEFTLNKEAYIFWFQDVSVVYYRVYKDEDRLHSRYFIECEVEKDKNLSTKQAKGLLNAWHHDISERFHVGEPLNDSLYEIFSGKKYRKV